MKTQKLCIFTSGIARCLSKVIYGNETMEDFKSLCSASYGKVGTDLELVQLTVFARNGDRSPEMGRNRAWSKRVCVKCPKNHCSMVPCRNGMLTIKGYHQGHALARFIKDEYYPKFSKRLRNKTEYTDILPDHRRIFWSDSRQTTSRSGNIAENREKDSNTPSPAQKPLVTSHAQQSQKAGQGLGTPFGHSTGLMNIVAMGNILESDARVSIRGYFYRESKHRVFLKSILETLEYSDLSLRKIDSLSCPEECKDLRNILFFKRDSDDLYTSQQFDKIISSLCTDVPINCEKFGCDLEKMESVLVQEKLNFEDNLARMREDIASVSVDFGSMADFLLRVISEPYDISLVSVSGKTIVSLLAGLNTSNQKLAPYGASVFIELWKNKNSEEFYSVLYDGTRMKFGLFKEEFVRKSEFQKFLKMFAKHKDQIQGICHESIGGMSSDQLLDAKKEKIKHVLKPIVERLRKNRILSKTSE